ncbi:MAG TPA: acyltransferase [Acidimicrobiales bacterium]|nr:acyltransferase [Acidimicrobiales bacterium]
MREAYLDALRAFSLLIVVVWHWVFTVIVWQHDGPHASNPIGATRGLWLLTWLLQVMPVFFFVGGYVHRRAWLSLRASGRGYGTFLLGRVRRLLVPAGIALAVALVIRVAVGIAMPDVGWLDRSLFLVLSPLWFLCVYIVLVAIAPAGVWLHERTGEAGLVVLVGAVAWVDLLRFHYDIGWAAWLNWLLVWGTVHQFGFFYERLRNAGRRAHAALALAGFGALTVLTNMGLYPRSMVGVPQESISNMGPPTLCILGLGAFQVGVVLVVQPWVEARLARPRVERALGWATSMSMPVFLSHAWGFALAYGVLRLVGLRAPETTNLVWWAQRPLWALAPLLVTALLLAGPGLVVRRRSAR